MSITNPNTTFESTGRDFDVNHNFIQNTKGVFVVDKDVTITHDQLETSGYMFELFQNGQLFPIHMVQDVVPKNEEPVYIESLQDRSYEARPGRIRHVLRYNFRLDYHQVINQFSGTDLYVIYYDGDKKIMLTEVSDDIYRGITTNRLNLEKFTPFTNGSNIVYSDLDIELKDSDEISYTGKIVEVDWLPELIDNLFISVKVISIDEDQITFTAKYNTIDITTIQSSDITVRDDTNGLLTFTTFNYLTGSYKLEGFSDKLTKGCLTVNAEGYIGRTRYRVQVVVEITNNAIFGDENNIIFGDGNNMIWGN